MAGQGRLIRGSLDPFQRQLRWLVRRRGLLLLGGVRFLVDHHLLVDHDLGRLFPGRWFVVRLSQQGSAPTHQQHGPTTHDCHQFAQLHW